MPNNKDAEFSNPVNDSIIYENLLNPPQLTPTGKISHAKTRVYTQRYRKAWEQMPDFEGWLTSVPHEPTRAFCTFCRKNLHAHRLSLLKHTCTMKHQRGALMHQKEANANSAAVVEQKIITKVDAEMQEDEPDEIKNQGFKLEHEDVEEDEDDIEYVVERLDDDDDNMEDEHSKGVEGEDYVEDEEDDIILVAKKLKTDQDDSTNRPDTLAEAMAHVHGEYLDENGESMNVELEMVVESVDPNVQEMQIVSIRSEREEDETEIGMGNFENDENSTEYNAHDQEKENEHENLPLDHPGMASSCKSSMIGESSDAASETDETEASNRTPLSIPARRDYLTRPSTARAISVLPVTTVSNSPAVTNLKKTITLTSGRKTMTLNTSSITSYPVGSRFLLNTKGQGSTIVVSDKGNQGGRNDAPIKIEQQQQIIGTAGGTPTYSVPGTSQLTPRKHIILKSVKPLVAKKPCISTHVLDTSKGLPVGGLQISLYKLMDGRWTFLSESNTTADGRCVDLVDTSKYTFTAGRYKLHFDVDKYFTLRRIETMYPFIEIIFDVKNPTEHYHIPVLISPFGYTTYRGS